ncbi:MAG: hypothetical protein D6734_01020 [Candidatus Schekmanbacteria bacterium]|nr:MAG: hypothetical protein D6734_01020 [Candidatus Schekmanbacteria bacterium]
MTNIQSIITKEIQNIVQDFEQYPSKYLTEEDVRSFLVAKLLRYSKFSKLQNTHDGSKSISVHTEIRWYGNSGKLKYRSDIVIIDVSSLKTKDGMFKIPSKGYSFSKPKAIVEVKLRRVNGESDNKFISKIQKDIDKLKEIRYEIDGGCPCYLIVLDKKKSVQERIFTDANGVKIYYGYSSQ